MNDHMAGHVFLLLAGFAALVAAYTLTVFALVVLAAVLAGFVFFTGGVVPAWVHRRRRADRKTPP